MLTIYWLARRPHGSIAPLNMFMGCILCRNMHVFIAIHVVLKCCAMIYEIWAQSVLNEECVYMSALFFIVPMEKWKNGI